MNVTPPAADSEYSTGSGASKPLLRRRLQGNRGRLEQAPGSLRAAILAGSLLGALMLVVAEFTTLFTVHVETSSAPIKTVATGPHHSYALLLIAIVVAALAIAVWRDTQPAGAAGDRAARSSRAADRAPGRPPRRARLGLAGSSTTRYVDASSTPSAGLYLETLGAVVLVITCGVGFIALGSPQRRPEEQSQASE